MLLISHFASIKCDQMEREKVCLKDRHFTEVYFGLLWDRILPVATSLISPVELHQLVKLCTFLCLAVGWSDSRNIIIIGSEAFTCSVISEINSYSHLAESYLSNTEIPFRASSAVMCIAHTI